MVQRLFFCFACGVMLMGLGSCGESEVPERVVVSVDGQDFQVELAYTRAKRGQGLMYRGKLGADEGMLFLFADEGQRSFYMKNCWIDLDALFIRADGTIANIHTMRVPKEGQETGYYDSDGPVKYVLEVRAGTAKKLGIRAEAKVVIPKVVGRLMVEGD